VNPLVRQAKEFSGVSSAEPEIGQRSHRFDRLLLRLDSGSLRSGPCTHHIVRHRRERCGELVADQQVGRGDVEPEREGFADAALGLAKAAAVGLAAGDALDADVPGVVVGVVVVDRRVRLG